VLHGHALLPCAVRVFSHKMLSRYWRAMALLFATYFYTLVRLYQLGSSDTKDESRYPIKLGLSAN